MRRRMNRWNLSVSTPTTINSAMSSRSWASEPRAWSQSEDASDTPMPAAAGIVVTEMRTQ